MLLARSLRRAALCISTIISLTCIQIVSPAAPLVLKGPPKLSWRLGELSGTGGSPQHSAVLAGALSVPEEGPGSLVWGDAGRLLVSMRVADTGAATLAALRAAGAEVAHVSHRYRMVTASVAPASLAALAGLPAVAFIGEVERPEVGAALARPAPPAAVRQAPCTPGIVSEGDGQLRAADARAAFAIDGSGVTVGVLSDSFDRALGTPTDAARDAIAADLPGPGNPCGRTTPVTVLADSFLPNGNSDEGRAMLHIVHDLAPGANLAFATAIPDITAFADNIRALRAAGADILVDDISYFVEPFYQDGPVSVAIGDVAAQGALYFTSAGNSHAVDSAGNPIASYEAAYRPAPCPLPGIGLDCHGFDGAASDPTFAFTLDPGARLTLIFQWAQPWFGVESDLDIFLVDGNGNRLAGSTTTNNGVNGSQLPYESFSYTNRTGAPQVASLVIARASGPPVSALKYVLLRSSGISATEYNGTNSADTFGPTIRGHSAASAALSVAALPPDDAQTPEEFSSRGPVTIRFGPTRDATPAAPFTTPESRQKPDIAATNGNQNSFFGNFDGAVFRFFGTSSAAPHAAAVAALLRQRALQRGVVLSQFNGETILETTAAPLANGTPQSGGAGRIDALAALYAVEQIKPQTYAHYLLLVVR